MIPGSNKDHPSFLKSFSYAMEGFVTAVKTERNIKVMLVAGVCTVIAGCIVGLDIAEWATIIICCGLVIHGELCNTAMEAIVDLATQELHPLAKRAKDIAATICSLPMRFWTTSPWTRWIPRSSRMSRSSTRLRV